MTPLSISWRDLDVWIGLSGRPLHYWECQLLLRLSRLRAAIMSEALERNKPSDNAAHGHPHQD